ncbi:bacteriocin immunity protein [Pseudomonas putida]|uniref:bacteriocin immunity protein n=1 Tax=Pseudomonas putida TaxID=303 RepID=UPI0023655370|nr:bacteriocin immunity protein [Pseudomonas putida]MDD2050868.1 bacteriocin immunity protein [Pseudomonas putida]
MKLKTNLADYTEQEFKALIKAIDDSGTEEERDALVEHFNKVVPHPAGSDLLYYPEEGTDESPDGVVKIIQAWCLANGLSGFKPRF